MSVLHPRFIDLSFLCGAILLITLGYRFVEVYHLQSFIDLHEHWCLELIRHTTTTCLTLEDTACQNSIDVCRVDVFFVHPELLILLKHGTFADAFQLHLSHTDT